MRVPAPQVRPVSRLARPGLNTRLRPLAHALAGAWLLAGPLALQAQTGALPGGLQVVHGQAQVATQGSAMTVRNSAGAILNWQSFSIGSGNSVYFDQASAASKVLNRVTGQDPSHILGRLGSNGQVWLLNPNGVLFGANARVDVAGLVASTLRLGDNDFLAGRHRFNALAGDSAGVHNQGALHTSFGGQVVLLGSRVDNSGDIQTPGGQATLAAARSVELVDTGLPNLAVRVDVPAGEVLNLGRLAAAGGVVDIYGGIVNQQGLVQVDALQVDAQGRIRLQATDTLLLGAASRTSALGAAGKGGDITLLGRQVGLLGGAEVDASGATGGGRIRVGGGLQGQDASLPNAQRVGIAAGAQLRADAQGSGDGGQVIVWADGGTRFQGHVSARGGAAGGDGGFAEVSGKQVLDYAGTADLSAPAGQYGSLLLDPAFIVIQQAAPNLSGVAPGVDLNTPTLLFADFGTATSTITSSAVNAQLAAGNVVLQATQDISLAAGVTPINGTGSLTLQAGGSIALQSAVTATGGLVLSANDPGGLPIQPLGSVTVNAPISAGNAALSITNNGGFSPHLVSANLTAGTLSIAGDVQLGVGSTWTLSGTGSVYGGVISGTSPLTKAGPGDLRLTGANVHSGTTVAGGSLSISGGGASAGIGAISVGANGLDIDNGATVGNSILLAGGTIGNAQGNGTLTGSVTLTAPGSALISLGTGLTVNGQISGAFDLSAIGGNVTLAGSNNYTGGTTVTAGTLSVSGVNAFIGAGNVSVSAGAQFNVDNGANLSNAVEVSAGTLGNSVGTGTLTGAVTLTGNVNLASSGIGLTLGSAIGGAGGLTVQAGNIDLTGANTYGGATNVVGGLLLVQGGAAIPDTSTVTLASGATLGLQISETIGALTGAGGAIVTLGASTLTTGGNNASTSYAGVISGAVNAGNLVKTGAGSFTLSGANTYAGFTNITAGTLVAASGSALGSVAGATTVASGATLEINNVNIGGEALNLVGTGAGGVGALVGTGTASAGGAVTLGAATSIGGTGTLTLSGVLATAVGGGFGLAKSGTGTLILSGANTYPGATVVNAGTLVAGSAAALGTTAAGTTVASGATLELNSVNIGTEALSLAGAGVGGVGALVATGTPSAGGAVTLTADSTIGGSGTLALGGVIGGAFGLTKAGAGTLTLAGANAYTGATTVNAGTLAVSGALASAAVIVNAGSLTLGSADRLADSAAVTVAPGATLQLGGSDTVASLAVAGTLAGTGTLTAISAVALNGGTVGANVNLGPINSTGNSLLAGTSAGGLTVSSGTLTLASANRLIAAPDVTLAAGSTLALGGNESFGSLSGAGTVNLGTGTLSTGVSGASSSFAGNVVGSGSLVKAGTGTFTVTGTLAQIGTTTVDAGSLTVDSTNTLSSLILNGGEFAGTGDVAVTGAFLAIGGPANLVGSGSFNTLGSSTVAMSTAGGVLGVNKPWLNSGTLSIGDDDRIVLGLPVAGISSLTNLAGGTLVLASSDATPLGSGAGTTSVNNAGTLLQGLAGAHAVAVTNFDNSGTVLVLAGTLGLNANVTQGGLIDVAAGSTLDLAGNLVNNGTISGSGSIVLAGGSGTLSNQGTLSPGAPGGVGTLSVSGNLALGAGTLLVELGGTAPGSFDQLAVTGNATLGGALTAALAGTYVPASADFVPIVTATGTASGTFAALTLPAGFSPGYNLAAGEAARLIFAAGPATRVFSNAAGNLDWGTPANWGGSLPGAADSALISAGFAVQHGSGIDTVADLTVSSANALNVSGGSLTVLGNTALDGSFTVSGAGAATLAGGVTGAGSVAVQAGTLLLNGASTLASANLSGGTLGGSGSLTVTSSFTRSVLAQVDPNFSSISLTQTTGDLAPGSLIAGTVTLSALDPGATLRIDAGIDSSSTLDASAAGALQVAPGGSLTSIGDMQLSARTLALDGPVDGRSLQLSGANGVQFAPGAALLATVGLGDAIVINAGSGPFVNNAGAGVLNVTGAARWLVWSADPLADTVGGLAGAFRQYNATFGVSTPAAAGNGLLYSLAPVLTAGLQGTVSKVYDNSVAATLLPANYAVGGALAIDSVVLNNPGTGSYTSAGTGNAPKDVGSGKTVTVPGVTATATDAGTGIPVFGYQFSGTASGAVGSITPLALSLAGAAVADKVYDGGTVASFSSLGSVTPLGADVVSVGGAASASFGDANVGVGKLVGLSGLTLIGADAANYTLALPVGVNASITPATLTYTAAPVTAAAGLPLPALGGSLAGFVAGETLLGATTGTLAWTTPASNASPAGSYAILGGGLAATNYVFIQAAGNATALTLQGTALSAVVADLATAATLVGFNNALLSVQIPLAMSTPVAGRVLDATPAFAPAGDSGGGAPVFGSINLSQLPRADVQSLLAARDGYKKKVLAGGLYKLEQDPALADVRACRSEAELSSGNCIITEQLKQEIEVIAARAAAARAGATAKPLAKARKPGQRKVKQAVLPRIERKLALLIGVNRYADKAVPQLEGAVPDVRAVRALLETRLGYETQVLEDASRESIVRAFNKLALEADADDSVIVYYAGHGVVVPINGVDTGFWLPSDVDAGEPRSWLANADIARMVAAIGSRQLMLVSDSCYSGTLAGNERVQVVQGGDAGRLLDRRAVVVMSSGGNEPVADEGREGHSVFAWHLMRALEGLDQWQPGSNLFERVRAGVVKDFPQTPQYGASRAAGHQGDTDYVFERRELDTATP